MRILHSTCDLERILYTSTVKYSNLIVSGGRKLMMAGRVQFFNISEEDSIRDPISLTMYDLTSCTVYDSVPFIMFCPVCLMMY